MPIKPKFVGGEQFIVAIDHNSHFSRSIFGLFMKQVPWISLAVSIRLLAAKVAVSSAYNLFTGATKLMHMVSGQLRFVLPGPETLRAASHYPTIQGTGKSRQSF